LAKEPSAISMIETFLGKPEELMHFVKKNGGTDYTRTISGKYYAKAEKIIDELQGTPEKNQLLKDILKLANAGSIMKESI
jgi:geranylgeranyl pyrophosphate synthase